ncbi:DUF2567 domain-containing protein [Haloechinothrix sp. LS1_15]|uniref:DUF2567 domain-containing protein n=1 Tax=Haloechinothrix sp. LS1_15 TaxID=2652248 RepID=UPI00294B6B01|nr:DUF2567 domain-containing protein [Haloechinothrix sp. LS1_15]
MPGPQVDEEDSGRTGSPYLPVPVPPQRERSKVVIKADLLPAVSVLSMVGLIGIPLGWLWAQLAPPQRSQVLPDGSLVPTELESWHQFDALVIFALFGLGAGIVIGVLVWLLRERRGPVIMIAAVAGSLLAAWLASLMGEAFVGGMYEITEPPEVGDVVTEAPQLDTPWVLVAQPFATALTYGLLAAWNGTDDLGRRLG